ncbi:hypothetical protein A2W24_05875 [Microgenomates group bacterium RBG_16_45_19]|nr:MAG: hypothetical protein A2W24_05875 [Microgenomates group bacterium RBG_16_45_19]
MRRFHHISFYHAFQGLKTTFLSQPNLRLHLLAAGIVLMAGIYFQLTRWEWLILMFTVMWVLVTEMVNTVIEAICDLLTSDYHREVKVAKDVASAMVLVGTLGAVMVGVVIFLPYLLNWFSL